MNNINAMHTSRLLSTSILSCLAAAAALTASCSHEKETAHVAGQYRLTGTIAQDSLHDDMPLALAVDAHGELRLDTLPVVRGRFSWQGSTTGVDELYLSDAAGRSWLLYGMGGQDLEVEVDSLGRLLLLGTDSLNTWLADKVAMTDTLAGRDLEAAVDSLCRQGRTHLGATLLLRHCLAALSDSVGTRRILAAIQPEAKPQWLLADIERMLDAKSRRLAVGQVARPCRLEAHDSIISLIDNHPNGYLIYMWADYEQASVDSLAMLTDIARAYGVGEHEERFRKDHKERLPKRLDIISVCLHAADSAAWRTLTRDVAGHHVYLAAGLADPRMRSWGVSRAGQVLLLNQYGNVYATEAGAPLRKAIARLPDKGRPLTPAAPPKAAAGKAKARPATSKAAAAAASRKPAPPKGSGKDGLIMFKDVKSDK